MVVVGGVVDVVGGVLGRTSEVVKKKNHTVRVAVDPTHSFKKNFFFFSIGLFVCLVGCWWWCCSCFFFFFFFFFFCLFVCCCFSFSFLSLYITVMVDWAL